MAPVSNGLSFIGVNITLREENLSSAKKNSNLGLGRFLLRSMPFIPFFSLGFLPYSHFKNSSNQLRNNQKATVICGFGSRFTSFDIRKTQYFEERIVTDNVFRSLIEKEPSSGCYYQDLSYIKFESPSKIVKGSEEINSIRERFNRRSKELGLDEKELARLFASIRSTEISLRDDKSKKDNSKIIKKTDAIKCNYLSFPFIDPEIAVDNEGKKKVITAMDVAFTINTLIARENSPIASSIVKGGIWSAEASEDGKFIKIFLQPGKNEKKEALIERVKETLSQDGIFLIPQEFSLNLERNNKEYGSIYRPESAIYTGNYYLSRFSNSSALLKRNPTLRSGKSIVPILDIELRFFSSEDAANICLNDSSWNLALKVLDANNGERFSRKYNRSAEELKEYYSSLSDVSSSQLLIQKSNIAPAVRKFILACLHEKEALSSKIYNSKKLDTRFGEMVPKPFNAFRFNAKCASKELQQDVNNTLEKIVKEKSKFLGEIKEKVVIKALCKDSSTIKYLAPIKSCVEQESDGKIEIQLYQAKNFGEDLLSSGYDLIFLEWGRDSLDDVLYDIAACPAFNFNYLSLIESGKEVESGKEIVKESGKETEVKEVKDVFNLNSNAMPSFRFDEKTKVNVINFNGEKKELQELYLEILAAQIEDRREEISTNIPASKTKKVSRLGKVLLESGLMSQLAISQSFAFSNPNPHYKVRSLNSQRSSPTFEKLSFSNGESSLPITEKDIDRIHQEGILEGRKDSISYVGAILISGIALVVGIVFGIVLGVFYMLLFP